MNILIYRSNDSAGHWWLTEDDWQALEQAGWVVHWFHEYDDPTHTHAEEPFHPHMHLYDDEHVLTPAAATGEDWLGCYAKSAAIATDEPLDAMSSWESIVGQNINEVGCRCCGPPHHFEYNTDTMTTWNDDDEEDRG